MAKSTPAVSSHSYRNAILAKLSQQDLNGLREHLKPVELKIKQLIYQPNEKIEQIYFPESGMISLVSIMENGSSIEVGTIGREGVVGASLLCGDYNVPYQLFVQIAGNAFQLDAALFAKEVERKSALHQSVLNYLHSFLIQSMQCTACNGMHSVAQRCCRWLLMSQDRSRSDKVSITHEFLSLMLGVRRASVTEVLKPLHERGWIESHRGEISIVDRAALEAGSCECYQVIKRHQST
jgi:CRP-like cAMP-binding protein